jgi:VacB/RNase II family 3'-5' exoribonuclease
MTIPLRHVDLQNMARETMRAQGFEPDFSPAVAAELAAMPAAPVTLTPSGDLRDLRALPWSSIDNDTSRDLDQIEVAERLPDGRARVSVGIADVDAFVPAHTPIDDHAAMQTTTVYTGVRNFPMLPEALSTGVTSLLEGADKLCLVIETIVGADGTVESGSVYRAVVRNAAQLTYNAVGAWLEGTAPPPPKLAASSELQAQLKLQSEAAEILCEARHRLGALDFDRTETEPAFADGQLRGISIRKRNAASRLIEDFMVAANQVMAQTLSQAGVSSIRRIVKTPKRRDRIVGLAADHGDKLPEDPDSAAVNAFLRKMRLTDNVHYPDISLAIVKLMGPGEYALARAGSADPGHFALAVHDYTHSTAPNRRFPDLVTQRLIKSVLEKKPAPYTDPELESIASNCTLKEDAARKVERTMEKRIAAVALIGRIGTTFDGVITGVTPKGTFVRVTNPPAEGLLIHGEQGVDVGDQFKVKLVSTDPRRGYLDFARQ